jgi:acyl carrier protein
VSKTIDDRLDALIRAALPTAPDGLVLAADLPLAAYGLDSIGTVGLIAALEDAFGCTVPDEELVPANFRTPGAVRALLTRLEVTT